MKKILGILFTLVITISMTNVVHADTLSDYQKQLEAIKAEQKTNAQKLTGLDQEIAQDLYDMMDLDSKAVTYSTKLGDLQTKVDEVNNKLNEQEKALQNSAQSYNNAEEVYTTRLRIIYENGIPSMLDIFLSSESISDFFSKMNVLTSILEYDKSLVNNMQSQKEYIDYIKKDIEIQKVQLEQLKYDTEKTTTTLNDIISAKENKVKTLQNEQSNLTEKNKRLNEQAKVAKDKIESEIAKLLQNGTNYTGNFTGKFTWPVPGVYLVTAMFNDREYYAMYGSHSGFDIGASEGHTIVAMADGVVITAGYGGYGNYVVIDHGDSDGYTYATLYGHARTLHVTKGQIVTKGQKIADSGNTGPFTTGAHVHVEVIKAKSGINWVVDGMDYFGAGQAPFTYLNYGKIISYPFSNESQYQRGKIFTRSTIIK